MVLTKILQQVPCRRLRARCYAVLLVMSQGRFTVLRLKTTPVRWNSLTQVESDCPKLLPKAAVTKSEAVAAVDV